MLDIYKLMKQFRLKKGYTQREVAEKLCIETHTYNQYENKKRRIDVELFFKIVHILELPVMVTPDSEADEEQHLLSKIKNGDHKAKTTLISSYLSFVHSIALKYEGRVPEFIELITAGNTGLLKAIDKYDSAKGHPFNLYATWWIRQSMIRFISDQSKFIRIPTCYYFPPSMRLKAAFRDLEHTLGRKPSSKELSDATGFNEESIRKIFEISAVPLKE